MLSFSKNPSKHKAEIGETAFPRIVVRPMIKILLTISVALTVLAGLSQTLLADPQSAAKDVSIIASPGSPNAGNVKVTFTDGHTEVLTQTGDCSKAKVSGKGNVGWIRFGKTDSLVVRFPDGTIKKFPPFGENTSIIDWKFADDGKTLVVRSMGRHGPSSYVQYDPASGKAIDSRGPGYTPYAKLPPWAKSLADPVTDE